MTRHGHIPPARVRGGQGITEFLAYFRDSSSPERLLLNLYQRLQGLTPVDQFEVNPSDDLERVYGLVEDDLDSLVLELLRDEGCVLPPEPLILAQDRIVTVADLARYLGWVWQYNAKRS